MAVLVKRSLVKQIQKKHRICLEIGERVNAGRQNGIIFSRKGFMFDFYMFYDRSYKSEIMLNIKFGELCMNIYKSC